MPDIDITRKHSLTKDELRKTAEELAETLKEKLDARYHWEGDELRFRRSGADGKIEVHEDRLRVTITLGLLLKPLRGLIEGKINEYLDKNL